MTQMEGNGEKGLINKSFYYANKIKKILSDNGFSEIYGYTFSEKGEVELANSVAPDKKFLRTNLTDSMTDYLEFNARYSELVDMPQIKIFEISKIFKINDEHTNLVIGIKTPVGVKGLPKDEAVLTEIISLLNLGLNIPKLGVGVINKDKNIVEYNFTDLIKKLPEPSSCDIELLMTSSDMRFKKISVYPFSVRDVAVFTPEGTTREEVWEIIKKEAGSLLVKDRLFDVFTKKFPDGSIKTSYGFRLVLQSYDHTLSEEEITTVMNKITIALNNHSGYQVR
jgi:phenylalanyl-tRNA synthetase beta subunit